MGHCLNKIYIFTSQATMVIVYLTLLIYPDVIPYQQESPGGATGIPESVPQSNVTKVSNLIH